MARKIEVRDNVTREEVAIKPVIILAGASGDLGYRIGAYLLQNGAQVKALARKSSSNNRLSLLQNKGATIVKVDYNNAAELATACSGGTCVVSALSGLHDVILEVQTKLLEAAVAASVLRFIPSDYSIDYSKLPEGSNRNLDLRRQFSQVLDSAPISGTSILNGMFTDLLTGQAPIILFGPKRVVYWGSADQLLDFTTIDNTAAYTAYAAMDAATPRYLKIAGDVKNIKGLQQVASAVTGQPFKRLRPGGLGAFANVIKLTRTLMPKNNEVFPAWQGMQYMHNMFTGMPKLEPLDNNRYRGMYWTSVEEVLKKHIREK